MRTVRSHEKHLLIVRHAAYLTEFPRHVAESSFNSYPNYGICTPSLVKTLH